MSNPAAPDQTFSAVEVQQKKLTSSVIVVIHNQARHVDGCLSSLLKQTRPPEEIIVVDNGSSDGSPERVRGYEGVTLLAESVNHGYTNGNNVGARAARGEVLVFLNPDVVLDPDWHAELVRPLEEDERVHATQSLVLLHDEPALINTSGTTVNYLLLAWCGQYREPRSAARPGPVAALSGASFAIRREVFFELGAFDPDYFMYHEDIDLSLRLRLAGGNMQLAQKSICYHEYRFSKPRLNKLYLVERNRLSTLLKTYSGTTLLVLLPAIVALEAGSCAFALSQRSLQAKLAGYRDLLRDRRRILAKRRIVQAMRAIPDRELKRSFVGEARFAELQSALVKIGSLGLEAYWAAIKPLITW